MQMLSFQSIADLYSLSLSQVILTLPLNIHLPYAIHLFYHLTPSASAIFILLK
jgi:hypothetical protein